MMFLIKTNDLSSSKEMSLSDVTLMLYLNVERFKLFIFLKLRMNYEPFSTVVAISSFYLYLWPSWRLYTHPAPKYHFNFSELCV